VVLDERRAWTVFRCRFRRFETLIKQRRPIILATLAKILSLAGTNAAKREFSCGERLHDIRYSCKVQGPIFQRGFLKLEFCSPLLPPRLKLDDIYATN